MLGFWEGPLPLSFEHTMCPLRTKPLNEGECSCSNEMPANMFMVVVTVCRLLLALLLRLFVGFEISQNKNLEKQMDCRSLERALHTPVAFPWESKSAFLCGFLWNVLQWALCFLLIAGRIHLVIWKRLLRSPECTAIRLGQGRWATQVRPCFGGGVDRLRWVGKDLDCWFWLTGWWWGSRSCVWC